MPYKYNFAVRSQGGDILVIPDYTEQVCDRETRHHLDYNNYGKMSRFNGDSLPMGKKSRMAGEQIIFTCSKLVGFLLPTWG